MSRTRLQRLSVLVVSLALLALSGLAAAQAPVEPVILNFDGDLWVWEGVEQPLTPVTEWGRSSGLALSPDGTRAAFFAHANVFTDWLQTTQGAGGFLPPQDVWLFDVPLRQTRLIAGQPDDATYNGPDAAGKHIVRQDMMWSPDGQKLAWIDIVIDSADVISDAHANTIRVTVYDLVSRKTQHLTTFLAADPSRRSGIEHHGLAWTESGILMETHPQPGESATTYRIYTASGDRMTQYKVEGQLDGRWIRRDGRDYVLFGDDRALDLTDGTVGTMPGRLELYSLSAPDGAFFLSADGGAWTLNLPGQAPVELGDQIRPYGISRDGTAALYGRNEIDPATGFYAYTVIHHSSTDAVEIGRYDDVQALSGPVGWRIRP